MQEAIHIVLCDSIALSDDDIEAVIERGARAHGFDEVSLTTCSGVLDLADYVARSAQGPRVELALVDIDHAELSGMNLVHEVRDADALVPIVIVASDASAAKEALAVDAVAYLLKPVSAQAFEEALERCWPRVSKHRDAHIELRFRDRVRSVDPTSIIYAETADHDQILHLTNGESFAMRSSSQGLFDQLSHDTRFFKAGSSYIVNLDHVRYFSSTGELMLDTGEEVTVPVRLRKALEAALFDVSV